MQKNIFFFGVLMFVTASGQVTAQEGPIEKFKAKHEMQLETQCKNELLTYCANVVPGQKRMLACLYAHNEKLSAGCEEAFYGAADELRNATANVSAFAAACRNDMETFCSKVAVGEGRVLTCLEKNREQLSGDCKEMLQQTSGDLGQAKDIDYQYHTASVS